MTLKELHRELCALGFDDCIAMDSRFLHSVCRALTSIFNSEKIKKEAKFFVTGQSPTTKVGEIHHKGGGVITLPLIGKAYSMRLFGAGKVTVTDGKNSILREFNCNGDRICGFLKEGGYVTFEGELSYTVYNLVTFDEVFDYNDDAIPDGSTKRIIDVREMFGDFLAFVSIPTDKDGRPIESASLSDGKLIIDSDYNGEINLSYRRLPSLPSIDDINSRIDVPMEFEFLIPILSASYLLLDDDPEKAKHYKEVYESLLADMKMSNLSHIEPAKVNTNGWA